MISINGCKALLGNLWGPLKVTKRFRRVNIQRPRPPHYERARILKLVEPFYAPDSELFLPPALKCKRSQETIEYSQQFVNPLEKILAQELTHELNSSKIVAICHANPISGEDKFQGNVQCFRGKMRIKSYSRTIVDLAIKDSIYAAIGNLFVVHTSFIFCEELNANRLLKVLKKIPQLILLAAIVEGRLLSVSQLKDYCSIKDLRAARSELVGVLNSAAGGLVTNLSSHQSQLVSHLEALAQLKRDSEQT